MMFLFYCLLETVFIAGILYALFYISILCVYIFRDKDFFELSIYLILFITLVSFVLVGLLI